MQLSGNKHVIYTSTDQISDNYYIQFSINRPINKMLSGLSVCENLPTNRKTTKTKKESGGFLWL